MTKLDRLLRTDPHMTHAQAMKLWETLTPIQREQFNEMLGKLQRHEVMLNKVNFDDQGVVQTIIVEDINKPSQPDRPFYKHFRAEDDPS